MNPFLESVILGLIQGITEWLPVSSSGHLVLAKHVLGVSNPLVFEIALHFASMLAVVIVFREKLLELLRGVLAKEKQQTTYVFWLFVATLPIAIVGVLFKDAIESIFNSITVVGVGLLLTAVVLFVSYKGKEYTALSLKTALLIGVAQSIAIFPGVSRSGMTICAALLLGLAKKDAAEFSFILSIPAILGATLVSLGDISNIVNPKLLVVSMITCFIVSIFSLKFLLTIIQRGKWWMFGVYCLILGIIIVAM